MFTVNTAITIFSALTNEVLLRTTSVTECYTENREEARIWATGEALKIADNLIKTSFLKREDPFVSVNVKKVVKKA